MFAACEEGSNACKVTCDGQSSCHPSYSIAKLSMPERKDPHYKTLRSTFTADDNYYGSLSRDFEKLLQADFSESIVVTGDVPLSASETIKLPEYVPLLILRDPPGGASSSSWSKGSSHVFISIEMGNGAGETHTIEGMSGHQGELKGHFGFSWMGNGY